MRRTEVDTLRQSIRDLLAAGLRPRAIAAELGCHRATVYKVLKDPSPDRRGKPHRESRALTPAIRAELHRLADDPASTATDVHARLQDQRAAGLIDGRVPSLTTITRALAFLRQHPGPAAQSANPQPSPDPFADIASDDYRAAAVADPADWAPAVHLIYALLRHVLRRHELLKEDDKPAFRLRKQAAILLDVLTRVRRGVPVTGDQHFEILEVLRGYTHLKSTQLLP